MSLKRIFAFILDFLFIGAVGIGLLYSFNFDTSYFLIPSIRMFAEPGFIASFTWFAVAWLCKDLPFFRASLGKKNFRAAGCLGRRRQAKGVAAACAEYSPAYLAS